MCFNDRFLNVSSSESVERKSENKPLQNLTNRGGIRDHSSGTRGSWSAVFFMESEIKLSWIRIKTRNGLSGFLSGFFFFFKDLSLFNLRLLFSSWFLESWPYSATSHAILSAVWRLIKIKSYYMPFDQLCPTRVVLKSYRLEVRPRSTSDELVIRIVGYSITADYSSFTNSQTTWLNQTWTS